MAAKSAKRNVLVFDTPASCAGAMWRGALPTGNGVIGASVYGGAAQERILVNHAGLAWQGHTGVLPDVSDKADDVRRHLDACDYAGAERILSDALINKGYRPIPAVPLPLADILVEQKFDRPVQDYRRSIDFETGEVSVAYRDGGTRYERNLFVSRADDLIVYEITRTGQKNIDLTFSLDLHDRADARTSTAISKLPENAATRYEKYFMYLAARSDNATDFGLVARISIFGGALEEDGTGIRVKGAEKVLLLAKPFVESIRDKEWKVCRAALAANRLTYDKLLKAHADLHRKLFLEVQLDLDGEETETVEDALRALVKRPLSASLVRTMWAYGRYLMITGTSPSSAVLRPTGLWCGEYKAADSAVDAMGSLQQTYAAVLTGGLEDFLLPVFDKYETMLDDLKKNASRLYNARGIFVPAVTAPNTGLVGSVDPAVLHSTWIAGSIAELMYDYWLYTRDTKFLKTRALPFMREVARFYETFLRLRLDGVYESSPSYSYGNSPRGATADGRPLKICRNSTMDYCVARQLFGDLITGARVAKMYGDEIDKWKEMLKRIPNYYLADGFVREYNDAKIGEEYESGSLNMLYAIYPGRADLERDPEYARVGLATARKRESTGIRRRDSSGYVRLAAIFARLGAAEDAFAALDTVVRTFTHCGLAMRKNDDRGMGVGTCCGAAPRNLPANMGLTAAVQEMLVQSADGLVRILPACPAAWKVGEFKGMRTRAGVEVDLAWNCTRRASGTVRIRSRKSCVVDIVLPEGVNKVKGFAYDAAARTVRLELAANKAVTFSF